MPGRARRGLAVPVLTMTAEEVVADGIATALLSSEWARPQMAHRVSDALGLARPTGWVRTLVRHVADAYRDPPADRPRELAAYVRALSTYQRRWARRPAPRIVHLEPVPVRATRHPWPTAPVDTLADLAALLDVDQGELAWFADVRHLERTSSQRLRHYTWLALPKRGGIRLVAAPKPRLKEIQRRVLRALIAPIPPHPAAHGCVPGRSVRTALDAHAGHDTVIRLDLEAFYPSIVAGRVWGVLRRAGLTEPVAHAVTGLATTVVPRAVWRAIPEPPDPDAHWRLGRWLAVPHLAQGAPTSPALANLVAFSLDRRLAGLAARWDATYTRYVDDLTFSGGPSLYRARSRFVALATEIVATEGFAVNERKTVVLRSSGRQQVLSTVVNAHPAVPRPVRDALRAELHNCAVRGWQAQADGRSADEYRSHLLGRIAWIGSVHPAHGERLRALADAIDWGEPQKT